MYWWIILDSRDNFDWDDFRHTIDQVALFWAKDEKEAGKLAQKWGFDKHSQDFSGRYKTIADAKKSWKNNQRGNKPHRYNEIDFAVKNGKMKKANIMDGFDNGINEEYFKQFKSKKYGITSTVIKNIDGKFIVSLKDDDTNQTIQNFRKYPDNKEKDAISYAKSLVKESKVKTQKISNGEQSLVIDDLKKHKGKNGVSTLKYSQVVKYKGKKYLIYDFDADSSAPNGATLILVDKSMHHFLTGVEIPDVVTEGIKKPKKGTPGFHAHRIAVDTVKNPNKALLGGPSVKEAKTILKREFGYSDKDISKLEEGYKINYPSLKKLTQLHYTDPRVATEGKKIHIEKEGNFRKGDENISGHYVVYEDTGMPGSYIGVHIGSELSEDSGEATVNVVAMDSNKSNVINRVAYRLRQSKIVESEIVREGNGNPDLDDGEEWWFLTYTENGNEYNQSFHNKKKAMDMVKILKRKKTATNISLEYETNKTSKFIIKNEIAIPRLDMDIMNESTRILELAGILNEGNVKICKGNQVEVDGKMYIVINDPTSNGTFMAKPWGDNRGHQKKLRVKDVTMVSRL